MIGSGQQKGCVSIFNFSTEIPSSNLVLQKNISHILAREPQHSLEYQLYTNSGSIPVKVRLNVRFVDGMDNKPKYVSVWRPREKR